MTSCDVLGKVAKHVLSVLAVVEWVIVDFAGWVVGAVKMFVGLVVGL